MNKEETVSRITNLISQLFQPYPFAIQDEADFECEYYINFHLRKDNIVVEIEYYLEQLRCFGIEYYDML